MDMSLHPLDMKGSHAAGFHPSVHNRTTVHSVVMLNCTSVVCSAVSIYAFNAFQP